MVNNFAIHFKTVHNKVRTDNVLYKTKLVDAQSVRIVEVKNLSSMYFYIAKINLTREIHPFSQI